MTCNELHIFKLYSLIGFNKFIHPWNNYYNQDNKISIILGNFLGTLNSFLLSTLHFFWTSGLFPIWWSCNFLWIHVYKRLLHCFQQEISHVCLCSSVHNLSMMVFRSSLYYCYVKFLYDLPWCSFHLISCNWGSLIVLDLWAYSCGQIQGDFDPYFFKYHVSSLSILLSPSFIFLKDYKHTYVRLLRVVPELTGTVFICFYLFIFCFCFSSDYFYCYITNFTHLFFCNI